VTLTVEDDFREFVAARWPDLEAVAFLVTLDVDVARRVTTDALAGLHQQWRDALDEGRPGEQARRSVLVAAVAASEHGTSRPALRVTRRAGPRNGEVAGPAAATGPTPVVPPREDEPEDAVVEALTAVLREATPVERAVVAGHAVWAAGPDEVAHVLRMPVHDVRAAAGALRARLSAAHDRARASEGLAPADWALDRDVDDAVTALLGDQGDPPDPAALVAERSHHVRRRAIVAGGLAVVGVAAGAWVVGRGLTSGTSVPPATGAALPPPGDRTWEATATWAPRGALSGDSGIQALVIARLTPGARLLWADEVGDRRVVVVRMPQSGTESTFLSVWSGPRGADAALLEEVPLSVHEVTGGDVVAVAVPDGSGATSLLVLLGPPRVMRGSYSVSAVFTPAGGVRRRWTEIGLTDGVATALIAPPGPALRVRLGRLDGAPAGTQQVTLGSISGGDVGNSLMATAGPFAMYASGPARPGFLNELAFEGPAPGDVIDPTAVVAQPREGRVAVVHTTTPEGALLRSVRVRDDGRGWAPYLDLEVAHPLAPEESDDPFALPLPAVRDEVGRFLVIAPGAAQAQLLAVTPNAYPVSKVGDLHKGTGVLEVVNARQAAVYRLVLWDARGLRLGSWRQLFGRRDPNDLWPRFTA